MRWKRRRGGRKAQEREGRSQGRGGREGGEDREEVMSQELKSLEA